MVAKLKDYPMYVGDVEKHFVLTTDCQNTITVGEKSILTLKIAKAILSIKITYVNLRKKIADINIQENLPQEDSHGKPNKRLRKLLPF